MNKKVLIAFSMLFLSVAAVGVEFLTVGMFFKAQAAKSWPQAPGTITKSEVVRKDMAKIKYLADVQYTYTVDDKKYDGDVVRLRGNTKDSKGAAGKIVNKYPVEAEVEVFYDEDDPSDAMLEPGADFVSYVIMISPLVFAAIFGFAAYGTWADRKSTE